MFTRRLFLSGFGAPFLRAQDSPVRGVKTHFPFEPPGTLAAWEARRVVLQRQILTAAGLDPLPPRNPLQIRSHKHFETGMGHVETITFEPFPGLRVGGNIFRPLRPAARVPAVLIPHGHWKRGRVENKEDYSVPALGLNLARQGYIALSYDLIGYNDAAQVPHDFGSRERELWSFTPFGLQLWTTMRALDLLLALPRVDARRVGVTGASGGGTQTFLLTAIDSRVRVAAPVNMISAHMQGGDPCEDAPGLRIGTSNVEFGAMAAPRPMHIVSCTGDWTKHTPEEEYPAIRKVYELYGRAGDVGNTHLEADHNYNAASRTAVYRFLARYLRPAFAGPFEDAPVGEIREADFLAGVPGTATLDDLFARWKQLPVAPLTKERLRGTLHVAYPATLEAVQKEDDRVELRWPGMPAPVKAKWRAGGVNPIVLSGSPSDVPPDRSVLLLDDFDASLRRKWSTATSDYFHCYNLSEAAIRVQQILAGVAFVSRNAAGKPHIIGTGEAAIPSMFAAALSPVPVDLTAYCNGFRGSDSDFLEKFFVPGIQRLGGLAAVMSLVNTKRPPAR